MKWIIPSGDQQHASGFEPRIFRFPRIATQFTSPNGSRTHKEELASWEHDSLTWAGSGSENILESYHKITSLKTQNEIHPLYSDISDRIQIYNLRELSLAWEGFEHKKSQTIWLNTNCWPNLFRYAYFAWKVASIWCSCFQNINVTFDRFIMEVKSSTGTDSSSWFKNSYPRTGKLAQIPFKSSNYWVASG